MSDGIDFDAELDDFADGAGEEGADGDETSTDAPAPDGGVADRRALLQQLVDAGGPLADVARESLVALEEREAKAAKAAEVDAYSDNPDELGVDLEQVKERLRADVLKAEAEGDETYLRNFELALRRERGITDASEATPEDIAQLVAEERKQVELMAQLTRDGDPLDRSAAWDAYQVRQWAKARELEIAKEALTPTWDQIVEDGEAEERDQYATILARAEGVA